MSIVRKGRKGFTLVEAAIAMVVWGGIFFFCIKFATMLMQEDGDGAATQAGATFVNINRPEARNLASEFLWNVENAGAIQGNKVLLTNRVVTAVTSADFDLPAGTDPSGIADDAAPGPAAAGGTSNLLLFYDTAGQCRTAIVVDRAVRIDDSYGFTYRVFNRNSEVGPYNIMVSPSVYPTVTNYLVQNPLHASALNVDNLELEYPIFSNGITNAAVNPGNFQTISIPRVVR